MVYALCCYLERTEMQLEKYFLNVNIFFFFDEWCISACTAACEFLPR